MNPVDQFSGKAKLNIFNGVDLGSNVDESTFALQQSGYATFFDLGGALSPGGEVWVKSMIKDFTLRLRTLFDQPGVQIDFSFTKDPDRTRHMLEDSVAPSRLTARNIGMDAQPLFDDVVEKLLSYVAYEGGLICFKTSINALSAPERKRLYQKRKAERKISILSKYGANPELEVGATLRKMHTSKLNVFAQAVGKYWDIEKLSCKEAIHRIRSEVCLEMTPKEWGPILWGDKIPIRDVMEDGNDDISHLVPPMIGLQLFPQRPEYTDDRSIFKMGERYIAPLNFHYLPEHLTQFGDLFRSISPEVPFRYTVSLETGTSVNKGRVTTKKRFAQIFSFTNSNNNDIAASADYLLAKLARKIPWVSVRASLVTWGRDMEEAKERKIQLIQEASTWGGPEFRDCRDDPFGEWMHSLPGVAMGTSAGRTYFPLDDAIRLLPVDRPTSVWKTGALPLRSTDGKLIPFEPFSKRQTTWNMLLSAKPGFGKTVTVMAKLLASCFAAGLSELPRMAFFDIGHSTEGFIELLQAILPDEKKGQAILVNMKNDGEDRINPFDIPLGMLYPPEEERAFVDSFMENLVTPLSGDAEDVLVSAAVKLGRRLYDWVADEHAPLYEDFANQEIASYLSENAVNLPDKATWQEVRDELFDRGELALAEAAHRQAMPVITMAGSVITNDQELLSAYESERLTNGTPVLAALKRILTEAVESYPIMSGPSTYTFGEARVIAFNLRSVAQTDTPAQIRQTRVMYDLARKAGALGFFATDKTLVNVPARYRSYHQKMLARAMSQKKEIVYEEFHVPATRDEDSKRKAPIVRRAETEEKTGRKSSVGVNAVSQQLEDFSQIMVKNASSVIVLFAGDEEVKSQIKELYGLEDHVIDSMSAHLTGPTPDGAPLFAIHDVKGFNGKVMQEAVLTLGGLWMWSLCSTETDILIRRAAAERLGYWKGVSMLRDVYPAGEIGKDEKRFKDVLSRVTGDVGNAVREQWVRVFVDLLIDMERVDFKGLLEGRRPIDRDYLKKYL